MYFHHTALCLYIFVQLERGERESSMNAITTATFSTPVARKQKIVDWRQKVGRLCRKGGCLAKKNSVTKLRMNLYASMMNYYGKIHLIIDFPLFIIVLCLSREMEKEK